MSVKTRVFKDCIAKLEALGLQYAIIDEKGIVHGNLSVTEKETRGPRLINWEELYKIRERISQTSVGDVIEFSPLDGHELSDLQSQIASSSVRNIGKGNYATSCNRKENTVEFMRIK